MGESGSAGVGGSLGGTETSAGVAAASGGAAGLLFFLVDIKELVQKFENAERVAAGPASAWVPPVGGAGEASAAGGVSCASGCD